MKVTNLKTIYLTPEELKTAIAQFLINQGKKELAEHIKKNECDLVWTQDNKEFIISVDGEIEE